MRARSVHDLPAFLEKVEKVFSRLVRLFVSALVKLGGGDSLHKVERDPRRASTIGQVRNSDGLIGHNSSFRAGFDTLTIGRKGRGANPSPEGLQA